MPKTAQAPVDRAKIELGRTIGEVSRAWRFEMNRRLKPFGLNLSMRQVLVQLQRHPDGLIQRDLARRLGIEGPTLVRLLDKLEERAWIQRMPGVGDKRRKYAVLTPKATEQLQIIEQLTAELRVLMMSGISADELQAGLNVMAQIRNNLMA
ncbi:MAG: transcriptional regulator, MarR family [Herminiimonas sp.]|jgi:MarR family transcriptional regulator for hemolysin|nr:transcriptional regulator, MarR family [Herminiimonas sp.]